MPPCAVVPVAGRHGGAPLGRTHDGGGHEALHHIPGDGYRRPAARVIRPQVVGRGAEQVQSAKAARIGWGCGRF